MQINQFLLLFTVTQRSVLPSASSDTLSENMLFVLTVGCKHLSALLGNEVVT